jgi:cystathionine beta-lyase
MKDDTILAHAGLHPHDNEGIVNPPVYHASTVLFPTLEAYRNASTARVRYGRRGTPTTFALEEAVTALEDGEGAVLAPSGLAAIALSLTACVETGDHVLVTDSTYAPTRRFCDGVLSRFGVETDYYDPLIGGDIEKLFKPNTKVVWVESPGTQTFEIQDIPAIAKVAHAHGARVLMDNTWATGYFFKALKHGVDISVHAGTKYIVGHSDAMFGIAVCNKETYETVRESAQLFGNCAGPDDVYLALRGFRTMGVRLMRHHDSGLMLANWLQERPEVLRVMHPGLPDDPGHELWRRDFTGASGLFGFVLDIADEKPLAAFVDELHYFGMGASWGGFESLILPAQPENFRTATEWNPGGQTMRLHVGLEDPDDLIADLEAGFERMNQAR